MTDALRRALRTTAQAFLGTVITSGILSATQETGVVDWSAAKKALVSALAAGLIGLVSLIVNLLEDNTRAPALLKAPPSPGVNPVPDPDPNTGSDADLDELKASMERRMARIEAQLRKANPKPAKKAAKRE